MKRQIVIALVVIAIIAVQFLWPSGKTISDDETVTLADLPDLIASLSASGSEGAFWVVLVPGTAYADGNAANLQVSIENGLPGLDWVLLAERNIRDRAVLETVLETHGLLPMEVETNGVRYLRVEDPEELAELCREILVAVYRVAESDPLPLIYSGMQYP